MDKKEEIAQKVIEKIERLEDLLNDVLPKTDKKHKDEILDICSLLSQRTAMYLNEFGVNEDIEV